MDAVKWTVFFNQKKSILTGITVVVKTNESEDVP